MALLDQLLSGLTGVSGSPLRGVLMNVLGQAAARPAVQAAASADYSPASSKLV